MNHIALVEEEVGLWVNSHRIGLSGSLIHAFDDHTGITRSAHVVSILIKHRSLEGAGVLTPLVRVAVQ